MSNVHHLRARSTQSSPRERMAAHMTKCADCAKSLDLVGSALSAVKQMCSKGQALVRDWIGVDAWASFERAVRPPKIHDVSPALLDAALAVVEAVAKAYGLRGDVVVGPSRDPRVSAARNQCYWHVRKMGLSDAASGRVFKRHRKTVTDGVCAFEARLAREPALRRWLKVGEGTPEPGTQARAA